MASRASPEALNSSREESRKGCRRAMSERAVTSLPLQRTTEVPFASYKRQQAALARRRLYPLTVFYTLYAILRIGRSRFRQNTLGSPSLSSSAGCVDLDSRRIPLPPLRSSWPLPPWQGLHPAGSCMSGSIRSIGIITSGHSMGAHQRRIERHSASIFCCSTRQLSVSRLYRAVPARWRRTKLRLPKNGCTTRCTSPIPDSRSFGG